MKLIILLQLYFVFFLPSVGVHRESPCWNLTLRSDPHHPYLRP